MAHIFISYSRKDEQFARQLASALSNVGADVWIDVEDIPAGMNWSSAIQQGLDTCDVMLLIISPDSMKSENVANEWQDYHDRKKPLIPIWYRPTKMHFQLRRIQYVNFYDQEFDAAFRELHSELRRKGVQLAPISKQADELIAQIANDAAPIGDSLLEELLFQIDRTELTFEESFRLQQAIDTRVQQAAKNIVTTQSEKDDLSHDELPAEGLIPLQKRVHARVNMLAAHSPHSTQIGIVDGDHHTHHHTHIHQTDEEIINHARSNIGARDKKQKLLESLTDLNYDTQYNKFQANFQNSLQSYVIYGRANYGQRWLLNTLLGTSAHLDCSLQIDSPIKICFRRRRRSQSSIDQVWDTIDKQLKGYAEDNTAQDENKRNGIIKKLFKNLDDQDIIIVFNNLQEVSPGLLDNLLNDVWYPIVIYGISREITPKYRLIIFFIDNDISAGYTSAWCEKVRAQEPEDNYWPPVLLPVTKIKRGELGRWLYSIRRILPPHWQNNHEQLIDKLFNYSDDGIPEDLLESICEECGFNYDLWEKMYEV